MPDNGTYQDCGTYAALQRHKRFGTRPCAPCKEAGRLYMRAMRAASADYREKGLAQAAAYKAADSRLREAHSAEWERYYETERAVRGLRAVPSSAGNFASGRS